MLYNRRSRPFTVALLVRAATGRRSTVLHLALLAGLALGVLTPLLMAGPAAAQSSIPDCSLTQTGNSPLPDLVGSYMGYSGGLYPGANNQPPAAHLQSAVNLAQGQVQARNAAGQPDPLNGMIVLLSIGMSNTSMEFEVFQDQAAAETAVNPQLKILNGAQGAVTAERWADPTHRAWTVLDERMADAGVSAGQVQVAWIKIANFNDNNTPFPAEMQTLQADLEKALGLLKAKFPNLQLAFLSSRARAYSSVGINPEPVAYESGFAVRWLIESQLYGDPDLSPSNAPLLLWGPYLWVDGEQARSDGLVWHCSDTAETDGTHPSESGKQKIAAQLLVFFKTHPAATPWFLRSSTSGQPPVCSISASKTQGAAPLAVNFSSGASDPDGSIQRYAWTYDDSTFSQSSNPVKTFRLAGSYEVRLTVVDNAGNPTTCKQMITVTGAGGTPPPTGTPGPTGTASPSPTPSGTPTVTRTPQPTGTPTPSATPNPGQSFADVPPTHPYFTEIETLYAAGYTAGCATAPLRYCPEQTMNRAESAVFVVRGVHGAGADPDDPAVSPFADLAVSDWALNWANQLYMDGYTSGCGTDPLRYCPWSGNSRAEGAVFYLRMLYGISYEPPAPAGIFEDVAAGNWYADWVEAAYEAGILPACSQQPLNACPEAPLDRGLAAYMLYQAKDLAP